MVLVTKGVNKFFVPRGAFESVFERQGYSIIDDGNGVRSYDGNGAQNDDGGAAGTQLPNGGEDESNGNSDGGSTIADLEEKPIAQWSKDELKLYAEAKGVDLSGASSVSEVRKRIKAAMG